MKCSAIAVFTAFRFCTLLIPAASWGSTTDASTNCVLNIYPLTTSEALRCSAAGGTAAGVEYHSDIAGRQRYDVTNNGGTLQHDGLAIANARASYGNIGVYTLGNTIATSDIGGRTTASASSSARYYEVFNLAAAPPNPSSMTTLTFGFWLDRNLVAQTTGSGVTNSIYSSYSRLEVGFSLLLLDNQTERPMQTLSSFSGHACVGYCTPISNPNVTFIAPAGHDEFTWSVQVPAAGKFAITQSLVSESVGAFQGPGAGVGLATVESYNSAHTFMSVSDSTLHLLTQSGTAYATSPVPEPSGPGLTCLGALVTLAAARRMRSGT